MYKNFNLTESEREQILKMHKAHGYKKPLNEEMEDVDLGDRLHHDSASDFPNNNPYDENMKVIRKITQDINIGPNGIGGGPSPDNFNKITYAFDLALNKYGDKYNPDDVANALYHALYGFDDEDTSDDVQDNNVDYLHNEKPLNEAVESVAPKKTDATTNPYWKQLAPKLKALGFTEKTKRFSDKGHGSYPSIDFVLSTMTHQSGVEVSYPFAMLDYTGDYYPDYVNITGTNYNMQKLKNTSCMGKPEPNENKMAVKVQCVDYIYMLVSKAVQIRNNQKPLNELMGGAGVTSTPEA